MSPVIWCPRCAFARRYYGSTPILRSPRTYKVCRQYAYFPKDPFHVAAREIDVRVYYKGVPGGDDAADMGALYAYTYLSYLYVIIQLNGRRHIAHVARDRRTPCVHVCERGSLSLLFSPSGSPSLYGERRVRTRGIREDPRRWQLGPTPLSLRRLCRAHLNKHQFDTAGYCVIPVHAYSATTESHA